MSTKELPLYIIDAFTNVPFEGNPAAVCLVENEKVRFIYDLCQLLKKKSQVYDNKSVHHNKKNPTMKY
jgi:hypothetical protein